MERNAFLINKKIHQYILPGVLMTVAMQLGNVVDGMIVGNMLGPEAMAAIELSMPVLLLLQMPAMMLAMGGAAEAAVLLGRRETGQAGGIFTASLVAGVGLALVFALMTPVLPGILSQALAGNEKMAALVKPYIAVNFGGIPILTAAIICCYFMNTDNHPQLGRHGDGTVLCALRTQNAATHKTGQESCKVCQNSGGGRDTERCLYIDVGA